MLSRKLHLFMRCFTVQCVIVIIKRYFMYIVPRAIHNFYSPDTGSKRQWIT